MALTFRQLRKTNISRCEEHFHPIDEWSETDWMTALAGEVGELANFIKKRRRNLSSRYTFKTGTKDLYLLDCKKEIGDILTYLDLVAARLGFSLEECVRDKFNEVSKRVGAKQRL